MSHFHIVAHCAPMPSQQIGDQPAVTFFRPGFRTQQCNISRPAGHIETLRHTTLLQQFQKALLVCGPVFIFLIGLSQLWRWCQQRFVPVSDVPNLPQKKLQVGMFGKRRKLPGAVLSYVDHALDLRVAKQREELLRGFPCEANGA